MHVSQSFLHGTTFNPKSEETQEKIAKEISSGELTSTSAVQKSREDAFFEMLIQSQSKQKEEETKRNASTADTVSVTQEKTSTTSNENEIKNEQGIAGKISTSDIFTVMNNIKSGTSAIG
jgi:hypothetical protein